MILSQLQYPTEKVEELKGSVAMRVLFTVGIISALAISLTACAPDRPTSYQQAPYVGSNFGQQNVTQQVMIAQNPSPISNYPAWFDSIFAGQAELAAGHPAHTKALACKGQMANVALRVGSRAYQFNQAARNDLLQQWRLCLTR